ncbi:site-2 protease family protein [Cupriavidus pauculus]|uniref:Site-2 protease family protein n=1 Tax=Cupriavidus pauculus TaxID=82633 RepID=A0A2N5C2C9_9BURK|nr:site-2 protease family protein [Cupriavidus pauculus]PLP96382.1 site-2 protease family protein [Cupriavidus pauculus]
MTKLLLLLFGGLKLGKLAATGGTMLVSLVAYAWIYGWRYATGFVGLILVHEMGHYLAARKRGLDVGLPTFIPFVGAWVELKQLPADVETEAYVGLAGPVLGTVGALVCYLLARSYDSQLLLALAYAGCFINLFNLIPLSPFDGGRVTAVLSPRIWLLGVPVLVGLFLVRPSPILLLVALLAAPQVMKAWRYDPQAPENRQYYAIDAEARLTYMLCYLGLVAFLAIMTHDLHTSLGAAHIPN